MRNKGVERVFVLMIAGIPLALALASSQVFFLNSDTIFFLARPIQGFQDLWTSLFQYDDRGNFRPLTFWIASGLLIPLAELNIWAYRLLASSFHLINTWLFYRLLRLLTGNPTTSLVGAFFFGLHWVFFNITYGMVCLPDLCYVFFTFLALLAFQKYLVVGKWSYKILSLVFSVGAFLSKEMAVIIPLLLLALSCAHRSETRLAGSRWHGLRDGLRHSSIHWVLLALYLTHFALLGKGSILPVSPLHPYAVELSTRQLLDNAPYGLWLTNLPRFYDRSKGPSEVMRKHGKHLSPIGPADIAQTLYAAEGVYSWIAVAAWVPVLVWAGLQSFRRPSIRRYLPFCVALVLSLAPVMFLAFKQMPHNLYLANAGMAFWLALCMEPGPAFLRERLHPGFGIREWAMFAYLVTSLVGIFNSTNRSWLTHGSLMAENAVKDLQRALPNLPSTATLYFLKSKDGGLPWYYDGGNLFRIVLGKPKLSVHFQDQNAPLPDWISPGKDEYVLRVAGTHVFDVTREFLRPSERNGEDWIPLFDPQTAQVDRKEYYPRYDRFDTPNGGPAFAMPVHRHNLGRNALVLIGGTSIEANLPEIRRPTVLALGVCSVLDHGDGITGRLSVKDGQTEKRLFEYDFLPGKDQVEGGWLDVKLDLSEYIGRSVRLKIETYNRLGRNTLADWLAWSLVGLPKEAEAPIINQFP